MAPALPNLAYFLIPIFFGLAFAGFGAIFLVVALRARRATQAAQNWAASAGRVISTEIRTHTNYGEHGLHRSYEPVVDYEYHVMGSVYKGHRVAFGADTFGSRQAQQVVNQYPQGSTVTVYYDPNNPSEAVLERQAKGSAVFTIIGGLFAAVGLGICCIGVAVVALIRPV